MGYDTFITKVLLRITRPFCRLFFQFPAKTTEYSSIEIFCHLFFSRPVSSLVKMVKTRTGNYLAEKEAEKIRAPIFVRSSIPLLVQSTATVKKRVLTFDRSLKIQHYIDTTDEEVEFGTQAWLKEVVKVLNEPGVIGVEHIKMWMENPKHRELFQERLGPPKSVGQRGCKKSKPDKPKQCDKKEQTKKRKVEAAKSEQEVKPPKIAKLDATNVKQEDQQIEIEGSPPEITKTEAEPQNFKPPSNSVCETDNSTHPENESLAEAKGMKFEDMDPDLLRQVLDKLTDYFFGFSTEEIQANVDAVPETLPNNSAQEAVPETCGSETEPETPDSGCVTASNSSGVGAGRLPYKIGEGEPQPRPCLEEFKTFTFSDEMFPENDIFVQYKNHDETMEKEKVLEIQIPSPQEMPSPEVSYLGENLLKLKKVMGAFDKFEESVVKLTRGGKHVRVAGILKLLKGEIGSAMLLRFQGSK